MATKEQKTQDFTHVRVSTEKRERAKEIARKQAALESRDVHYTYLIDEVLEEGFAKRENELGINLNS